MAAVYRNTITAQLGKGKVDMINTLNLTPTKIKSVAKRALKGRASRISAELAGLGFKDSSGKIGVEPLYLHE